MAAPSLLRLVSIALLGLVFGSPSGATLPQAAKPAYNITGIRAQLYYETLNKFSPDVFTAKDMALFNVGIGEGGIEGPASNVLVTVEVSGAPESYPQGKVKLQFLATANGKTVAQRTSEVKPLGAKGKVYLPFWLYQVGGDPLKIKATLVGAGAPQTVSKTIPFEAGE